MGYVNKTYLSTQFKNFADKIAKVFSKIGHTHLKSDITDFPTSMPANGGNAATVGGHTVGVNVPENAVFTDTVYDDTEVKEDIYKLKLNSNLGELQNKYFSTPDFSKAENISSLTSFTVPANGYLYIACQNGYVQYMSNLYNVVEGVLNYSCSSTNTIYVTSVYPVTKDEILTRKNTSGKFLAKFVPCK